MIDFHVHAGELTRLRDDIQALLTRRRLEEDADITELFAGGPALEQYLRSHGVRCAVLLAECGPGTNFSIDSEMIVRLTGGSPFFVPFGSINPNFHDVRAELNKSVELGVRGFKFYPADHGFDPYTEDMLWVYGRCEELGLPIMFHTGSTAQRDASQRHTQPEEFESIACTFPALTLILAHAGRPTGFQAARRLALTHEHLYLDTALVEPTELIREYGAMDDLREKLLFGSDWPVAGSYRELTSKLLAAGIAPDVLTGLLQTNARRVLGRAGVVVD